MFIDYLSLGTSHAYLLTYLISHKQDVKSSDVGECEIASDNGNRRTQSGALIMNFQHKIMGKSRCNKMYDRKHDSLKM